MLYTKHVAGYISFLKTKGFTPHTIQYNQITTMHRLFRSFYTNVPRNISRDQPENKKYHLLCCYILQIYTTIIQINDFYSIYRYNVYGQTFTYAYLFSIFVLMLSLQDIKNKFKLKNQMIPGSSQIIYIVQRSTKTRSKI